MLRRFSLGFASIAAAVVIAACSSSTINPIGVGPTFPPSSLYATNTTQNAISIYANAANGGGPSTNISSTSLFGPEYLAFDPSNDLYVSAFSQSTGGGSILEFKAYATGAVTPYGETLAISHPRGLSIFQIPGSVDPSLVVADLDESGPVGGTSDLAFFDAKTLGDPSELYAGPATRLNVPSGLVTFSKEIYVTNLQGASVEGFPQPSAAPTLTPTPTTTASPTASPSPGVTASPTPAAAIYTVDQAPTFVIQGAATKVVTPVGIAVDTAGNIYVADRGKTGTQAAILEFAAGPVGSVTTAPIREITGSATLLYAPSDVKVDSTGRIIVSDSTAAGANVIYVWAAGATGNVAPSATYTSPGAVVGIALTP